MSIYDIIAQSFYTLEQECFAKIKIREAPRCTQKYIVETVGKDQGQVSRAIDKLVEVGLVSKKNITLMAL